jgi:hypothetical protein
MNENSIKDAPLDAKQQEAAFLAPCAVLSFLVRPERRLQSRTSREPHPDSAYLHWLYEECWTFRDARAVALLNDEERAVLAEFNRAFESQPWRVMEAHPHLSELPNDDLTPLIPAGEKLLRIVEARAAKLRRFAWLRGLSRFFGFNRPRRA